MGKSVLRFVIAGHVDHGKSTLIGRLLLDTDSVPTGKIRQIRDICSEFGFDFEPSFITDHFLEERERQITIDTTQIPFRTPQRDYVIIDVPGHKQFIENMITGASQAQAAVLIVDAPEGVSEQTRRHAYLLQMLSVHQIIVAVNKLDMAGYGQIRFNQVASEMLSFLESIGLTASATVPISAKHGDNVVAKSAKLGWYKGDTLVEALKRFTQPSSLNGKSLRLPVQGVYEVNGERIIVGRLESGTVRCNQQVTILCTGAKRDFMSSRRFVNEIRKYPVSVDKAQAGESVGLTLSGFLPVSRGEIIADSEPELSKSVSALIFWLSEQRFERTDGLIFKCVTQEKRAKIAEVQTLMDSSTLETLHFTGSIKKRQLAQAWIELESPALVEDVNEIPSLGRFILERKGRICAMGIAK